ncbi:MAG: ATP synthase F0 subunit C [Lawsonella sp.]|nr:ATP synthase F0 subunit C [Mycobacteriales bacterium]
MDLMTFAAENTETFIELKGLATLGYAFSTLGPALSIGWLGGKTVESMARQPEIAGQLRTTMILAIAFAEALALIALVAGFLF